MLNLPLDRILKVLRVLRISSNKMKKIMFGSKKSSHFKEHVLENKKQLRVTLSAGNRFFSRTSVKRAHAFQFGFRFCGEQIEKSTGNHGVRLILLFKSDFIIAGVLGSRRFSCFWLLAHLCQCAVGVMTKVSR